MKPTGIKMALVGAQEWTADDGRRHRREEWTITGGEIDPTWRDARSHQVAELKAELTRARELAAWFQAEHTRTLPVVANFRMWRTGGDTKTFHEQLRGDLCGKALALGPIAPMQALSELNDWSARKETP